MSDRDLDDALAALAEDEAALSPALRAAILDGLPPVPRRRRFRFWSGAIWGAPAAAALCGLWLGAVQPDLVLDAVPGATASAEGVDALADWEGWL